MKRILGSIIVTSAIVGSLFSIFMLASPPKAHASPASYISALENSTIADFSGGKAAFLNIGWRICTDLSAGYSYGTIIDSIYYNYSFDRVASAELFRIAKDYLCFTGV